MNSNLKVFLGTFVLMVGFGCKKDIPEQKAKTDTEILNTYLTIPAKPFNYQSPELPSFFTNQFIKIQDNTPSTNRTTDWGATLGRVLFYDKIVSKNQTIACASCHLQQFGFTDTAQFSRGFSGGSTKRHSMSLINATYYLNGRFFWDERASTLEDQVLMPIQDDVEMGMTLDSLVNRIQKKEYYPILFRQAFGNSAITTEAISKAMAQFLRSMVSFQSKYDLGRTITADRNADFPNFTQEENIGKKIFMTHKKVNCSACHNTDVFIMDNPRNNGLSFTNPDVGIFIHSAKQGDIGRFKTPSLKNVALRARFMHDGSLSSLDAVLNHYNMGMQPNPNLDAHLIDINGQPSQMNLTTLEIKALKAFLETLTDTKIIADEKFSSPFR